MKRYEEIDILKGVAVICMIIFHLFYFPNQYGFTPWPEPELANVSTYLIEDEDTRILPLSIWFNSIDLTPIQIDLFGQSVVFMQNESQSVYNILASDGSMKVGLVIY